MYDPCDNPARSRQTGWLSSCILVAAAAFVCFAPWLVSGRVLAPFDIVTEMIAPWRGSVAVPVVKNHYVSDAVTQYIPYTVIAAKSFKEDGYIGWNPFVFGGTAQSANTMALSHDWTTHLYRIVDFWTAWHAGRLLQFLVAGFGVLVFLHSRGCGSGPATLAAVAYMLNAQFVTWIYHHWGLASFCWMPWILWALHAACEKSPGYIGAAAGFIALALLGSTLQHAAFVFIALACLWAGWFWEDGWHGFFKNTFFVLAASLLGAGLVAWMLEPSIAAYLENIRAGHLRGGFIYESGPWQPVLNALLLPFTAYPFVLGSAQTLDLGKIFRHSGMALGFFGTLPVVLAAVSLFSPRVPKPAKLLMWSGLVLPLTPLVGVFYHRINLLWILGGCWAAAAWLANADRGTIEKMRRSFLVVFFVLISAWLLAALVLTACRGFLEPLLQAKVAASASAGQFSCFPDWLESRASLFLDYICPWNPWQFAALSGALLSIWGLGRLGSTVWWKRLGASVGVAVQLLVFWFQWTTWSKPFFPYENPPLVRLLQKEVGRTGCLAATPDALEDDVLPPNVLVAADVAVVGGYDSIHPRQMKNPSGRWWDFPGTTHFLAKGNECGPAGWERIGGAEEWSLWKNPLPAAALVFDAEGNETAVGPERLARPTLNTMVFSCPSGARQVELFVNWNRGWKWRREAGGLWRQTRSGGNGGILVELPDAPATEGESLLVRFDPSPPPWVVMLSAACALIVLSSVLLPRDLFRARRI